MIQIHPHNLTPQLHPVMEGEGRKGSCQRGEGVNMGKKGGMDKGRSEELSVTEDQRESLKGLIL